MPLTATLTEFESWLESLQSRLAEDHLRALDRGDMVVADALSRRMQAAHSAHVEVKAFESECDLGWWQGGAPVRVPGRRPS